MTLTIDRETLVCTAEQFAAAVDAHIAALTEYNEHLKGVEADAADPSIPHENKRVAFPPPEAPMVVMQAVGRRDDGLLFPDYEIVGPPLAVRKQRLMQAVSEVEQAEIAKVTPPGKARYWQMREQAIYSRQSEEWTKGGDRPTITIDPAAEQFLAEQKARREREQAIQLWAAKAHHDIEDLTEETVEGWKLAPLNG